jgi:hypothetical protein
MRLLSPPTRITSSGEALCETSDSGFCQVSQKVRVRTRHMSAPNRRLVEPSRSTHIAARRGRHIRARAVGTA